MNINKEKILEKTKTKISISDFIKEEKKMPKKINIIKPLVATILMILSCSGMVFAKEISQKIYDNFFGTSKGMETAMNEGYVENIDMENQDSTGNAKNEENGKIIQNINTKIKVEEFVMDDFNLSMIIKVTLPDEVKEVVNPKDIWDVNFPDLKITDENGNNISENAGLNAYIQNRGENPIKVVYNMYTEGEAFPKSKKLNFSLTKIKISNKEETLLGDEEITIQGSWDFTVDVPEKMYNRKTTIYKQISTTNNDFNVISATSYTTGIDLKLKFKAEKHQERPTTPELKYWDLLPEDDELKTTDMLNYLERKIRYTPEYIEWQNKEVEIWKYDKYIENENGKKFEMSMSPRANGGGFIDDDGIYESNCTFDLTKYDLTDRLTVYVDYHGNKAEILLEKVGE